jgi:hypothetical protein
LKDDILSVTVDPMIDPVIKMLFIECAFSELALVPKMLEILSSGIIIDNKRNPARNILFLK